MEIGAVTSTLIAPQWLAPAELPDLPPFDPAQAITLTAACNLGLVPGSEGRRLTPSQLLSWATHGHRIVPVGPPYLFPAVLELGIPFTTPEWCAAWVSFAAEQWEPDPIDYVAL
jgi:hypothetical protein